MPGLRRMKVFTYELSIEHDQFQNLDWYTGKVKDFLIWIGFIDGVLIVFWAIVATCERKPNKPKSVTA